MQTKMQDESSEVSLQIGVEPTSDGLLTQTFAAGPVLQVVAVWQVIHYV